MSNRFVILHHTGHGDEHWDLMLEHEGVLLTWQLDRLPRTPKDLPILARRIGDHRTFYLDYEGPVSHNRGTINRVDGGTVDWSVREAASYHFHLDGQSLKGAFGLLKKEGVWVFCGYESQNQGHP